MTAVVRVCAQVSRFIALLSAWTLFVSGQTYHNATLSASGNALWDDLMGKCDGPRTTMDCVRSRLYNYVNDTLEGDMSITDSVKFAKNNNEYQKVCASEGTTGTYREARESSDNIEDEKEDHEDDGWSKVTDTLYEKGVRYLMTHDLEASVPSFLSGSPGGKVKISPKKILPDGGVLVRLDMIPGEQEEKSDERSPRFMKKMIKHLFKKKLMQSLMALLMIIKLIKVKLMFILPLVVGASAAKKILLKVLLFIFPPLAHLFKMCSFYQHHAAKYHFHHHKIKHHHHHINVPVHVPVPVDKPVYGHDDYYAGAVLDHPPGYDTPDIAGSEYYNRYDMANAVSDHGDILASWGLGEEGESTPHYGQQPPIRYGSGPQLLSPTYPHADKYVKRGDDDTIGVSRVPQKVIYDPVFGPIAQKLDDIFNELQVPDEVCKEKLVCRMYGNPTRYSPHSNLVSAQLSSDTSATSARRITTSVDAARIWKYIQAAKEGQSGQDCGIIYPTCTMVGL
ncbi:uncharacterized protein LOC126900238 [Daktulosphaira vitifoliae]|uniref:uncharacterized protein LOC126900238 n=1 Tax=Daktulosphaira vitifoliae TaxID=58002 RepID=UPI0021AA2204|nr:uncharacterized protein LOC126900238 [Daktulosphaira vitifoliae]